MDKIKNFFDVVLTLFLLLALVAILIPRLAPNLDLLGEEDETILTNTLGIIDKVDLNFGFAEPTPDKSATEKYDKNVLGGTSTGDPNVGGGYAPQMVSTPVVEQVNYQQPVQESVQEVVVEQAVIEPTPVPTIVVETHTASGKPPKKTCPVSGMVGGLMDCEPVAEIKDAGKFEK